MALVDNQRQSIPWMEQLTQRPYIRNRRKDKVKEHSGRELRRADGTRSLGHSLKAEYRVFGCDDQEACTDFCVKKSLKLESKEWWMDKLW
jgi:hypothetical protein